MFAYNLIEQNNELKNNIKFLNKEIELYYLNSKAILLIQNNQVNEATVIFEQAFIMANDFSKNYVKAAILYNQAILLNDDKKLEEAKALIESKGYSMGKYILDNKDSKEHILNTFTINNNHYWICVKNVDLLV